MIWISAASVDISPLESVYLGCGTGSKVGPEEITDPLEANVLLVHSFDKQNKVVIISVDTLFLGPSVSNGIISGLSGVFENKEIFLAATHTHTAPMVDETKPNLGIRNDDYSDFLVSKIIGATLDLASEEPTLVTMELYSARIGGVVARRNMRFLEFSRYGIKFRQTLQRPNLLTGKVKVSVADFFDDQNELVATLAVIPCHPVALMGLETISPDFVGQLRLDYSRRSGSMTRAPFVFLQGASGDLNPWSSAHWVPRDLISTMDQILNGVRFSFPLFTPLDLVAWSKLRVQELFRAKRKKPAPLPKNAGSVSSVLDVFPMSDFLDKANYLDQRSVHIQQVKVEEFEIVGVSAELTSELKLELLGKHSERELVGCMRDSFGYITSTQQYRQGGYEVDDHQWHFSIEHRQGFSPTKAIKDYFLEGKI